MEEQKSKIVDMKPQENKVEQSQKLSYEQLEQVAHQLSEQTRQLYNQLQRSNLNNMFKRLDYLFKILENNHMFKQDFLEKCINEIEVTMTIPKEEDNKEEEISNIKSEE